MKKDKKGDNSKKNPCNTPQQKKVTRSWGLATRFEKQKMVKPKKKKKE